MSNAARKQKGLDCKHLRTQCKNEQVPSHDLHLDQAVMCQDPNDKNGIQPPLQDCVKNQEVTWLLPNKVYNTERHKPTWSHTILKVKMNS